MSAGLDTARSEEVNEHEEHFTNAKLAVAEFARFAVNGSKTPELDALAGKTCRVAFGNGMRPEVWSVFQKR